MITYKAYFELEDKTDYDFMINYGYEFHEAKDHLKLGSLLDAPFGFVKDCQDLFTRSYSLVDLFDIIAEFFYHLPRNIALMSLLEVYQIRNYILSDIDNINTIERMTFSGSQLKNIEIEAGIEKFDELGVYMQFSDLTGGDVTKFEHVRHTKYSICFLELKKRKIQSEYDKRYFEIINRKRP